MIGLDPSHLRIYVIEPALTLLHPLIPISREATQLVLGTAIVESELRFLDQMDKANKPGPAYGLWQMEGITFRDHFSRMSDQLKARVLLELKVRPATSDLYWNLRLAAQMCRILYWHAPEALPAAGDAEGMAALWKLRYNTYLGAGTIEKALPAFRRACIP